MSAANHSTWFGFSPPGESRKAIKELIEWLQGENEALKSELAALKAPPKLLSAEEVTEHGHYWWRSSTGYPWIMIHFAYNSSRIEYGQFIGPIQMPEA